MPTNERKLINTYGMETAADKLNAPMMKRTVKDSVFTNLFADTKYLIKLYRALHPEDKTTEEKDITNATLKSSP